jgi:hypothetical protein
MNQQLVAAIRRDAMPALGLINESKLCDEKRGQLASILNIWLDADLDLHVETGQVVEGVRRCVSPAERGAAARSRASVATEPAHTTSSSRSAGNPGAAIR